jgi:signal transduction histidine kinase
MGIRGKLIICFVAFALLMLAITWFFQIGLLNKFYEKTKHSELDYVAEELTEAIGTGNFNENAAMLGSEYGICVRVFKVVGSTLGDEAASVKADPTCLLHHMADEKLNEYYQRALENGGEWKTVFSLDRGAQPDRGDESRPPKTPDKAPDGKPPIGRDKVSSVTIFVKLAQGADGENFAVFLNSQFTPMTSTVDTLGSQFLWIAVAGIIFAAIFALIVSKSISSPIVRMNESAKKLAKGNYDADFVEAGHRETRELAKTLNFAAEEISKSDTQRRELIANVSHDLRTPLTMITGYAEMMRDIPGENTPENLQVIIDEAKTLGSLVGDMLDLSKIDNDGVQPQKTRMSLTAAVRNVLSRYSALIAHEGYVINFAADAETFVLADEIMITQVLYNLINNAVNYTGDNKTVIIRQHVANGKVRVSIADSGEGIAPEHIPHIWDRYYKLDKVHRRATVGSGLGLSIVKKVLIRHGASFGVESKLGAGSVFWFELDTVE